MRSLRLSAQGPCSPSGIPSAPLAGGRPRAPPCTRFRSLKASPSTPAMRIQDHQGVVHNGKLSVVVTGPSRPADDGRPLLYAHVLCPYAERVILALLEKEVSFRLVHIDLAQKPTWYRSVNPRGLVPALEVAGQVHVESLDICAWVDGAFEGPAMAPAAAAGGLQATMRAGASLEQAGLAFLAGSGRHWGIGGGQTPRQRAAFKAALQAAIVAPIERHGGPFLLGATPSLADVAVFPFARRFVLAAQELCGCTLSGELGENVQGWLSEMEGRPAGRLTAPDHEALLAAWRRHRSLDFFDYDSYAVDALHPQLSAYLERDA